MLKGQTALTESIPQKSGAYLHAILSRLETLEQWVGEPSACDKAVCVGRQTRLSLNKQFQSVCLLKGRSSELSGTGEMASGMERPEVGSNTEEAMQR